LWPLLTRQSAAWPERTLFTQSHRGDEPVLYHNFAARTQKWKLVNASGFGAETLPAGGPKFELFDMESDPYEQHNRAAEQPEVLARLKAEYEAWFKDVGSTRPQNYDPPRIIVGSPREATTVLTRQDWRGAAWGPNDEGHWLLNIASGVPYDVKVTVAPADAERTAHLRVGSLVVPARLAAKATEHIFQMQSLPSGDQTLEAWVDGNGRRLGVRFVELTARR
jgi:arylsulfatase/arylsulfatase A